MKKTTFFWWLCMISVSSIHAQPTNLDSLQNTVLSPDQMQADLAFYRKVIEETHPGLYRYNTRELISQKLDSLTSRLKEPMPYYEFYREMAAFNSTVKCGHSFIIPHRAFEQFIQNNLLILPYYFYPIKDKIYVLFNGSTNGTANPGWELLSINGQSVDDIANTLRKYYWADGDNQIAKNQILEGLLFGAFYYLFIEQPTSYELLFKKQDGSEQLIKVRAQRWVETQRNFSKNAVNKEVLRKYSSKRSKSWELSFLKDVPSTAYLKISSFSGNKIHSSEAARKAMRAFMEKAMHKFHKKKTEHLILDLRSNQGGWDAQSTELMTYLIQSDQPFKFYDRSFAVANESEFLEYSDLSDEDFKNIKKELSLESDGTYTLLEEYNPDRQWQQPKPNRFRGDLYILIDYRTGSAAADFAAIGKSHQIGTFVGLESGGAYEGGNAGSFLHFRLPHSKCYLRTPLLSDKLSVKEASVKGRGTIPDHIVEFSPEDLLNRRDRQLEFVKQLIRK